MSSESSICRHLVRWLSLFELIHDTRVRHSEKLRSNPYAWNICLANNFLYAHFRHKMPCWEWKTRLAAASLGSTFPRFSLRVYLDRQSPTDRPDHPLSAHATDTWGRVSTPYYTRVLSGRLEDFYFFRSGIEFLSIIRTADQVITW